MGQKTKTIKHLEKNVTVNLYNVGLLTSFLDVRAQTIRKISDIL